MTKLCEVCYDASTGTHFGVQVCSACTAFFRRTVSKNQRYRCKEKKACEILSTIRNICKSCRFAKCLAVGMKKDGVQKFRDVYGKRECPRVLTSIASTPILDSLVRNYTHLENVRQVIHRDETKSVFLEKSPRALNYKESINVFLKEYQLVEDWIVNSFKEFAMFPSDQKSVLLRNFYLQFVLLEGGHFACQRGRSDITYLPSGDYIDCVNPETYYNDPDGRQPISAGDAAKMFASSFGTYRRNVTHPMQRDHVDQFEFLALSALTLFDTGLEGQSEENIEICRRMRKSIQREVLLYCKLKRRTELDASIRLGNMLSILPNLQRAARRFHEDMTLSNVMNAYSVDQKFYELGKL
ncbi:CRE-NHR-92 protein [Caenorhabditis remanei]|uniref:CRE-NHR-92 protein n=1 Tax=Caenorhabditis remanei TaxID=31234 RepID=E3NBR2_CAERE|nr:CRE-NHR-92 protein [Caenorhabditis remanei]